jgi:hypothetical protein
MKVVRLLAILSLLSPTAVLAEQDWASVASSAVAAKAATITTNRATVRSTIYQKNKHVDDTTGDSKNTGTSGTLDNDTIAIVGGLDADLGAISVDLGRDVIGEVGQEVVRGEAEPAGEVGGVVGGEIGGLDGGGGLIGR